MRVRRLNLFAVLAGMYRSSRFGQFCLDMFAGSAPEVNA